MNYRIITVKDYFGKGRPAQVLLQTSCPDADTTDVYVSFHTGREEYEEVSGMDGIPAAQAYIEDYSERSARAFMDRAHAALKLSR